MLFKVLPEEILLLVLKFLTPRDIQLLQCTTRLNLLQLYRGMMKYEICEKESERDAFEKYHAKFFYMNVNRMNLFIPHRILNQIVKPTHMGTSFLRSYYCEARNAEGQLLLDFYFCRLPLRKNYPWEMYRIFLANAKYGKIADLTQEEEKDAAIILVKTNRQKYVKTLLENYEAQTPEMVMCQLHYGMNPKFPRESIFTQELCDYWILRTMHRNRCYLVNNLPETFIIDNLIACNPKLFFLLATKKTLKKYKIFERREEFTRKYGYFFPALLKYRKKFNCLLNNLRDLSYLHLIIHGSIQFLHTTNCVLKRSKIYQPPMIILRRSAKNADALFLNGLQHLTFLSSTEKRELENLARNAHLTATNLPVRYYLPYIFSNISLDILTRQDVFVELLSKRNCSIFIKEN